MRLFFEVLTSDTAKKLTASQSLQVCGYAFIVDTHGVYCFICAFTFFVCVDVEQASLVFGISKAFGFSLGVSRVCRHRACGVVVMAVTKSLHVLE